MERRRLRPADEEYLRALIGRLEDALGSNLVGVYLGGSGALGDYEPGRSDLDVAAVVRRELEAETKLGVVAQVSHDALPCPARCLELVVYTEAVAASPTADRSFELNLNTGAGMVEVVELQAGSSGTHWFPLDRSLLAQAGVDLEGPPAERVFAPIPVELLRPLLAEAVRWFADRGDREGAFLAACRGLYFAEEGRWTSKEAAARWATEREAMAEELARFGLDDQPNGDRQASDSPPRGRRAWREGDIDPG